MKQRRRALTPWRVRPSCCTPRCRSRVSFVPSVPSPAVKRSALGFLRLMSAASEGDARVSTMCVRSDLVSSGRGRGDLRGESPLPPSLKDMEVGSRIVWVAARRRTDGEFDIVEAFTGGGMRVEALGGATRALVAAPTARRRAWQYYLRNPDN